MKSEYTRSLMDILAGIEETYGPAHANRRVAAYSLFGMMNWIYNWYDPLGDLGVELLAQNIGRIFLGGYVGLPVADASLRTLPQAEPAVLTAYDQPLRAPTPLRNPAMTATMNEKATAPLVTYRKEGNIAVFELNDPPANTYTHEMMRQLDEGILKARFDDEVHVIVLRGAGEKFFSAGANINMLNTVDPVFKYFFCLHANETLSRLEQTPKLVIAALNGHTRGRRPRDRHGGGHPHRAPGRRQDRPPRGEPRRAPRHRRHPAAAAAWSASRRRSSSWSPGEHLLASRRREEMGIVNDVFDEGRVLGAGACCTPSSSARPTRPRMAVGAHQARACSPACEVPFECGAGDRARAAEPLFQSSDAKEGLAAYVEKRHAELQGEVRRR